MSKLQSHCNLLQSILQFLCSMTNNNYFILTRTAYQIVLKSSKFNTKVYCLTRNETRLFQTRVKLAASVEG